MNGYQVATACLVLIIWGCLEVLYWTMHDIDWCFGSFLFWAVKQSLLVTAAIIVLKLFT